MFIIYTPPLTAWSCVFVSTYRSWLWRTTLSACYRIRPPSFDFLCWASLKRCNSDGRKGPEGTQRYLLRKPEKDPWLDWNWRFRYAYTTKTITLRPPLLAAGWTVVHTSSSSSLAEAGWSLWPFSYYYFCLFYHRLRNREFFSVHSGSDVLYWFMLV